jgi:hypothetical protein
MTTNSGKKLNGIGHEVFRIIVVLNRKLIKSLQGLEQVSALLK